jgi:hypothetical protein
VARPAPLSDSPWRPTFGWWPSSDEYDVSVVLTPYHSAAVEEAEFRFALRGWDGGDRPVWEHEVGTIPYGEQRAVRLSDLDLPAPPPGHGGLLEIEGIRVDREPPKDQKFVGMWIDAQGRDGGGYIIPTVPIQGATKRVARDDVQVAPGVVVSREADTEIVLLNPIPHPVEVRLAVYSQDGLSAEAEAFTIGARSAWHGVLGRVLPKARRLLAPGDGVGSLTVTSSHRLLPFFGHRRPERPLLAMDHLAPIFD